MTEPQEISIDGWKVYGPYFRPGDKFLLNSVLYEVDDERVIRIVKSGKKKPNAPVFAYSCPECGEKYDKPVQIGNGKTVWAIHHTCKECASDIPVSTTEIQPCTVAPEDRDRVIRALSGPVTER